MSKNKKEINLDRILVEEVGQWGRFQLRALVLCGVVAIMAGLQCYVYLFTVVKIKTRCVIPECESSSNPVFSPPWIQNAVPASGDSLETCRRYQGSILRNSSELFVCPENLFDKKTTIECEEFVYEHQNSGYYEFNLACDDWRPTLIGSAKTLGYMISLPIVGLFSDAWGRRLSLTLTAFSGALIGTLTYFAGSYNMYIVTSFVESLFGACSFSSAYILAVEYVGPKYRVITGVAMSTCIAIGQTLLGLIAWTEPYWRHLILYIYCPQLIFVIYFWIAPESVRWLMSKGRCEEALAILEKAAQMNGSTLSEKTLKKLSETKEVVSKEKDTSEPSLIRLVFKHKPILLRCLISPFWWITCILMYYGLTISSVGISGNTYINYSATNAIEIPGYWIAFLLLDRIGRKAMLMTGFTISGACQIAFIFVSGGHYWLSLTVFLVGKMCVAGIITSLYVYTAELYPTRYRTSLFAYSSMIGRVGGILAPLTPGVAAQIWVHLPFLVFGVMALVSGMLVLLAPETLGATLPDSMEEAADLGKGSGFKRCLRTLVFKNKSYSLR